MVLVSCIHGARDDHAYIGYRGNVAPQVDILLSTRDVIIY